jgi:hypothetical protein
VNASYSARSSFAIERGAVDRGGQKHGVAGSDPLLNALRVERAKFQEGIGQRPPTQQAQHRLIYLVGQVSKESFDIATDEAPMGDIATSGP